MIGEAITSDLGRRLGLVARARVFHQPDPGLTATQSRKWIEYEGSPPRSDRLFPMWPIFFDVFAHNEEQPSLDKEGVCPPRI